MLSFLSMFTMKSFIVFALLHAATLVRSAPAFCLDVSLPITVTATNKAFPPSLNLKKLLADNTTDLQALLDSTPDARVSGDFVVAGRYCQPEIFDENRTDTLQVLVHGILEDRNYWSGLGFPGTPSSNQPTQVNGSTYSWVDTASKNGYATLSLDRLCNGASSRPNGLLVCQLPMNAAVITEVIAQARNGAFFPFRSFTRIIYVGHSIGSLVGNVLAQQSPKAADAYILTGFTDNLLVGALGTIGAGTFLPAAIVDPLRFGEVLLDLAYVRGTNYRGFQGLAYFPGGFDETASRQDFVRSGTVTVGEFLSAPLGQIPASQYTGPIVVLNGAQDQIFCARNVLDPLLGFRGDCGSGEDSLTARADRLFPSRSRFEWRQYETTGHSLNLHFSGQEAFADAHELLNML